MWFMQIESFGALSAWGKVAQMLRLSASIRDTVGSALRRRPLGGERSEHARVADTKTDSEIEMWVAVREHPASAAIRGEPRSCAAKVASDSRLSSLGPLVRLLA